MLYLFMSRLGSVAKEFCLAVSGISIGDPDGLGTFKRLVADLQHHLVIKAEVVGGISRGLGIPKRHPKIRIRLIKKSSAVFREDSCRVFSN